MTMMNNMKKIFILLLCSTAFANEITWGEYEANFSMDGNIVTYKDYENYLEEINKNDIPYDGTDWMFDNGIELVKLIEETND